MKRKPERKQGIFRRFLMTNLCLLIIPLLFCGIYLAYLEHNAREQALREILLDLTRVCDLIDLRQRELEVNDIGRIMLSPEITQALSLPYSANSPSLIYLVRARNALHQIFLTRTELYDAAVISLRNQVILSTDFALSNLDDFYRGNYTAFPTMEEWTRAYFPTDRSSAFFADRVNEYVYRTNPKVVAYVRHVISSGEDYWVMVRWLESDFFKGIEARTGPRDSLRVSNAQDHLLAVQRGSLADPDVVLDDPLREGCWIGQYESQRMIFARMGSETTGLRYSAAYSYDDAMAGYMALRGWFFFSMALLVLLAITLSVWMARRNARPIQPVVEWLDTHGETGECRYGAIMASIGNILRESGGVRQEISHQKGMLRGMLFEKLLSGGFWEDETWENGASYLGLSLEAPGLAILAVQVSLPQQRDDGTEQEMAFALIGDLLEQQLGSAGYVHYSDQYHLVLLIKLWDAEPDRARAALEQHSRQIALRLNAIEGIFWRMGVSGLAVSPREIPAAYRHALDALQYAESADQQTSWFEDAMSRRERFVLSMSTELKIINNLRAGNTEAVEGLISQEIDALPDLSRALVLLTTSLVAAIWRALEGMDAAALQENTWRMVGHLEDILQWEPSPENLHIITNACRRVCADIAQSKLHGGQYIQQKILNHIDQHYHDPQFGLQDMLTLMQMSSTAFQNLFKELTGSSFPKYLEELRLRKACLYLEQEDYGMQEIAERVGYNSTTSFRRAFKRVYSVSPMEYRLSLGILTDKDQKE